MGEARGEFGGREVENEKEGGDGGFLHMLAILGATHFTR